jgi:hypothetical protein
VEDDVPLPCPWCAGTTIWLQNTDERRTRAHPARLVYYACVACKCYGPDMPTPREALAAWNTRRYDPGRDLVAASRRSKLLP